VSIYVLEEIVDQLCGALGATHRSGFIHRDLKPENVFLVEGPTTFVKLLDYGVAKPTHPANCLDVDKLPAGTPQYMSPEHMFEPETTDERSDLFALAAVAYFAITGRSPFAASSLEALYFAIEDAKFERPSAVRPELPRALDTWFEKALARDRQHRFQTAHEMRGAFHEAVRTSLFPPPMEEPTQLVPAETQEEDTGIDLSPMTKSVPGLPKRRLGRSVAAVAATAVAACVVVWKADTEVRPASASVVDENAIADAEAPSGGNQLQAPAPTPGTTAWHATKKPPRPGKPRPPAPAAEPEPQAEAPPADSAIQHLIDEVPNPDVAP
jgi:serine/threonine-protein kinase